eukprot:TRINITY_DN64238_c0_g1_i1.p1 TRINITY_DN64238_c0_g1~~TRINITY_DN64238_c0_g1_i1.p1  ORF type:complete len:604 (+),score=107.68 TRINITY_DN64238_c0_g1_i1:48-1814(+)
MPCQGRQWMLHFGLDCTAEGHADVSAWSQKIFAENFDFLALSLTEATANSQSELRNSGGFCVGVAVDAIGNVSARKEALTMELRQAFASGFRGVILPALTTAEGGSVPCWYAEPVNELVRSQDSNTLRKGPRLAARVLMHSDGFETWKDARALFEAAESIAVAVEFPIKLTDTEEEFERWLREPVGFVIIPIGLFILNKSGHPVLPKRHKARLLRLLERKLDVILAAPDGSLDSDFNAHKSYIGQLFSRFVNDNPDAGESVGIAPVEEKSAAAADAASDRGKQSVGQESVGQQSVGLPEPESQPNTGPPSEKEVKISKGAARRSKASKKEFASAAAPTGLCQSASSRGPAEQSNPFLSVASQESAAVPSEPVVEQTEEADPAAIAKYYRECAEYFQRCAGAAAAPSPSIAGVVAGAPPAAAEMQGASFAPAASPTVGGPFAPGAFGAQGAMPAAAAAAPPYLASAANLPSASPAVASGYPGLFGYAPCPAPAAAPGFAPAAAPPLLASLLGRTLAPPQPAPAFGAPGFAHPQGPLGFLSAPGGLPAHHPMYASSPPPPRLSDADLTQLITAWYLSGYYTGHYAARQGR